MSDTDRTGVLKRKVKDILGDGETQFSQSFAPYWELFEATTEDMKIQSFYIRVEGDVSSSYSYNVACEVAAICDEALVNLYVNALGSSNPKKKLAVKSLSAIGAVNLHPGRVIGLHDTLNATLTVTTDHDDLYWCANNEDEWGYLMDFARDLIQRIAAG